VKGRYRRSEALSHPPAGEAARARAAGRGIPRR
jgi:hypothetical protein